jgi:hypothetical protein
VIHFSNGQPPIAVPADNLGADLLRGAGQPRNLTQTPTESPGDTISVKSISAALELGLMNHQNPNSLPAAGAADYQLARTAAVASEPATSMQHLEMAVHESPAYASVALHDPAFQTMRGPVQELADRVTFVAGTSESAPAGTYQPARAAAPMLVPSAEAPLPAEQPGMVGPQRAIPAPQDPESTAAVTTQTAISPAPSIQAPPDTTGTTFVRPTLAAPPASPSVASPSPAAPFATIQLPRAVSAALDLELLASWDTAPARATAGAEYQLALSAMQAGDRPAALEHLEQAILVHPAQAATALADPAFDAIRGSVRDLVMHLTVDVRMHAEASMSEARAALQSPGTPGMARPLVLARAYFDAAQASFQLGTYTGFLQAVFAADLAQQIAKGKISITLPAAGALEPVKRAVKRAALRLWRKLPLLAILFGWFVAGMLAGITSLAFQSGAELRAWLLPVWGMGLVAIVLFGFVRSIRRIAQRWN